MHLKKGTNSIYKGVLFTVSTFTLCLSRFAIYNISQRTALAAREGIVGKVRIGVSVVKVITSRKVNTVLVAICAVVFGALDHAQVSGLVNGNVSLVNLAAGLVERRVVEPRVAKDNRVGRRKGICDSSVSAVVLDVAAVQVRLAAAAGVGVGHLVKGRGDGVASALAGALKVLNHLVVGTVARSLGSLDGNVVGVLDGRFDGGAAGAAAVVGDGGPLGERLEDAQGLSSSCAVDLCVNLVGLVREGAEVLDVAALGVLEVAGRLDVEVATVGEIKDLGDVKGDFDGLAGGNLLESRLASRLGSKVDPDTLESDVAVCKRIGVSCLLLGGETS